tara:strand:+ start:57 stop:542 length:486 start_codon:yes stop_codon:yes gene_type:complete
MLKSKQKIFDKVEEPAIYIRYMNGVIAYIGETKDWKKGRPFRDGSSFDEKEITGDYDKVRILKASFKPERRRYWEAVLVTRYKPYNQQKALKKYYSIAKKDMIKDKELSVNIANKAKAMRKNNNEKLKRAAKIHLLKHMEIMIRLKEIGEEDIKCRINYIK